MPQLAILVINDPEKTNDVLKAMLAFGVTGATILDSSGMSKLLPGESRDDLPLFPSLTDILHSQEQTNRTIMTVLADDVDMDSLISSIEPIIGRLEDQNTGILFLVPVSRVWGLQPRRQSAG